MLKVYARGRPGILAALMGLAPSGPFDTTALPAPVSGATARTHLA